MAKTDDAARRLLFRAIAAGDHRVVAQVLAASPELAVAGNSIRQLLDAT